MLGESRVPGVLEREVRPWCGCQVSADSERRRTETHPQPWFCYVPSLLVSSYPDHLISVFNSAERETEREEAEGRDLNDSDI